MESILIWFVFCDCSKKQYLDDKAFFKSLADHLDDVTGGNGAQAKPKGKPPKGAHDKAAGAKKGAGKGAGKAAGGGKKAAAHTPAKNASTKTTKTAAKTTAKKGAAKTPATKGTPKAKKTKK